MGAAADLEFALAQVKAQEDRLVLLEKILVMALLEAPDGFLSIPPASAHIAENYTGGFDIGKGKITLIDEQTLHSKDFPSEGVSIRIFARTFQDEE